MWTQAFCFAESPSFGGNFPRWGLRGLGLEKKIIKNIDLLGQEVSCGCHLSVTVVMLGQTWTDLQTKSTLPAVNAEFHPEAAVELGMVFCNLGEYSVASVPFTGSCLCKQPPGKEKQRVCWQR